MGTPCHTSNTLRGSKVTDSVASDCAARYLIAKAHNTLEAAMSQADTSLTPRATQFGLLMS